MNKLFLILCFLLINVLQVIAQENKESNEAPKIIQTIPDFGDCQVDSSITEIIIEFDQDMNGGMSLVNCPHMPTITSKARWLDKRKISVPVQLNSNKLYQLVCNNTKFTNFRNTAGIPLNPYLLIFKTKQTNQTAENRLSNQKANQLAFEEFSTYFPTHYSHADRKNIPWKTKLSEQKSQFENSTSPLEFALQLNKLLSSTEDPHISIFTEGEQFVPSNMKPTPANFNFNAVFKNLDHLTNTPKWAVVSGKYKNIAYINILTWSNDQKEEIGQAFEKLKEFKDEANIIIDVRGNSGGNDRFAMEFASCFIKESMPYEKVKRFSNKTGKFDEVQIMQFSPNKEGFYFPGNVYLLIGNKVMSSNESFVLMMKQAPKVKTVGFHTYGSSGNPKPLRLSNNVTVNIPSWQAFTMDDLSIEGNGIAPDVEIITSKDDFANSDAVLDKVVEMIQVKSVQ